METGNCKRQKKKHLQGELSQSQINQRIKNINLTKRLISYERYINAVPKHQRSQKLKNDWHPETPRVDKYLSLSQWNKEMKKWRKQIHAWGNMPEEIHRHICSLSCLEKNYFLSKLKLPELSQVEINLLKKKNEKFADIILKNVLLIANKSNPNFGTNSNVLDKPFFFLPQNFSGVILNNDFTIIKHNCLEKSLLSLKDQYSKKYAHLFDKYYGMYLLKETNLDNHNNETGPKDIIIHLKRGKHGMDNSFHENRGLIEKYIKQKKEEAYIHLCFSSINEKQDYEAKNKRGSKTGRKRF
ncbi:histone RNA hairpin-binding protein, putative [Plasmodium ovale]|uniref:Histone RNA hairpin-binding protein RNA-binding domain-containing protein n=2 Tax=Plasmodium ovale TaxID=36330 RepID=A0A1A8VZR0_PLAOA|nr:hypothetical protein POVCU2_0025830 [Plasmodium ovale curtisi]SBS92582.1 hypothetical protein POVCU1_023570 [Plasmodium ovale curtisi]SCQ16475.1 histone RNA hairpin-binding protein, putative [Plasmodium ovale]